MYVIVHVVNTSTTATVDITTIYGHYAGQLGHFLYIFSLKLTVTLVLLDVLSY